MASYFAGQDVCIADFLSDKFFALRVVFSTEGFQPFGFQCCPLEVVFFVSSLNHRLSLLFPVSVSGGNDPGYVVFPPFVLIPQV